ncbi:MAG: hypothetical protein Q9195_000352 [Heterodermia aff. obscurata]
MSDRRYASISGGPPNGGRPPPPSAPPAPPTVRYVSISGGPPNDGRPPPTSTPPAPPTIHYVTLNGNPPNSGLPPSMIPLTAPLTAQLIPAPTTYVASFPAPPPPPPPPTPVITYQLVSSSPPASNPTPVYTTIAVPAPTPDPQHPLIKVNFWGDGSQPWNAGGAMHRFQQLLFPADMNIKEVCRRMMELASPGASPGAAVAEVELIGTDARGLPRFRKGKVWNLEGEDGAKAIGAVGRGAGGQVWLACSGG